MFGGIVTEVGTVAARDGGSITILAPKAVAGAEPGESIAVNGVCLTAASLHDGTFTADVMPETLRMTNLGGIVVGGNVNIERALAYGDQVGGHLVQGHVDGTGEVIGVRDDGNATWLTIGAEGGLLQYCVARGSVAIDGVSLTVTEVSAESFAVSLIPHTLAHTIAADYSPGTRVNLEVDMMAKYVARYIRDLKLDQGRTG